MRSRLDIDICPICGNKFDAYWGYKFFVGGTKSIVICDECYRSGQDKADMRMLMNVNKSKKQKGE